MQIFCKQFYLHLILFGILEFTYIQKCFYIPLDDNIVRQFAMLNIHNIHSKILINHLKFDAKVFYCDK